LAYTTTVINLIGGPGCGKSTLAAEIFAKMKRLNMNVEMVREVAKEWAWEGKKIGPFEQLAILGEQIKKESSLYGKVEYLVTDSPVLLGAFYFEHNHKQTFANDMVHQYYKYAKEKGIIFKNYQLCRNKPYNPEGRFESERQAKVLDKKILNFLLDHKYDFSQFTKHCPDARILELILREFIYDV